MNTRKKAILKAIIKEYVDTAEPVGSSILVKKYNFGISPATIRNEMAELEKRGYLGHLYTSSGRVPTDKGYRYFVDELIEKEVLGLREKTKLERFLNLKVDQLVRQTTKVLASLAHNLAILDLEDEFWEVGFEELFAQPEFEDLGEIKCISKILDNLEDDFEKLFQETKGELNIYIGEENPLRGMENCSIIITKLRKGKLGILGPKRMRYARNKSLLDFTSKLLDKVIK